MRPSRELIIAVKLADRPAWKIALEADVNPTVISRLITGAIRPKPNDPRLLRVGKVLGLLPEKIFEPCPEVAK
jgi:hypothetical protein